MSQERGEYAAKLEQIKGATMKTRNLEKGVKMAYRSE